MNLNDIAVLSIKRADYRCLISGISKNEAINLIQNADLTEKSGSLQNIKKLFSYIKMGKEVLTFGDIEIEKNKFYRYKNLVPLRDVNIEKVLVSNKIYKKYFLKTKIKSHGDEVTDFYDKKIAKLDSNHTCLAVITLDSALKKDDNYYPLVFLKECKYIEKKVIRHINDNSSDFTSSDESNEE